MTLASRCFALYPAALLAAAAACLAGLLASPSWPPAAALAATLYLVPPLTCRLLLRLRPLETGLSELSGPVFSSWWASHQVQAVYTALPALEALLRLAPGLYSAWLRLWGSRVGRDVYWTPRVEIHDRGLMDIGDRVVFGHKVECYGHVIKPKPGRLLLYVGRVAIGAGTFVGAGSRIAAGAVVAPGTRMPLLTDVYPNGRFPAEAVAP